jgi:hypothetical protein
VGKTTLCEVTTAMPVTQLVPDITVLPSLLLRLGIVKTHWALSVAPAIDDGRGRYKS